MGLVGRCHFLVRFPDQRAARDTSCHVRGKPVPIVINIVFETAPDMTLKGDGGVKDMQIVLAYAECTCTRNEGLVSLMPRATNRPSTADRRESE